MPLMPLGEFRSSGLLQEINRLILHPLGLSLTMTYIGNTPHTLVVHRTDDPAGVIFEDGVMQLEKAQNVVQMEAAARAPREKKYGFWVQPLSMAKELLDDED